MDFAEFSRLADRVIALSKGYQYRAKPPKDPTGWEAPTGSRKTWRKHDGRGRSPVVAPHPVSHPAPPPAEPAPRAAASAPAMGGRVRQVGCVGRCSRCKTGYRNEFSETVETQTQTVTTPQGHRVERTVRLYTYDDGRGKTKDQRQGVIVKCGCGADVYLKRVRGTVTDHKCDARCMHSTGPNCECSCGGRNHGAGLSMSV